MAEIKKRQAVRPTNKRYIVNSILYHLVEFYKANKIEITIGLVMAIVWLSGFLLGAMAMAGGLSV